MNTSFEYLYRDGGNFKRWGNVIFGNPTDLMTSLIEVDIRKALISGEYFVASEVRLPELYFEESDRELDHDWHEFAAIENTGAKPNDQYGRTIEKFIHELSLWTTKRGGSFSD